MMQEASIPPMCEVVILTALGLEYKAVSEQLQDIQEITHQGTVYGYGNFTGQHRTWHVAVAEIGMGGSTAAAETERAISYFRPQITLFIGVSGGLKDVKLGDVVVASKVYAYELGKAEQQFQPRPEAWHASHALEQRARAEARNDQWLTLLGDSYPDSVPQVHVGALAAGEKVLASTQSDLFRLLKAVYGDTLAIEMEGHGFLAAVHANHCIHALVIRGISDLIDGKSATDATGSQTTAARHAAAFAFRVLTKFTLSTSYSASSPPVTLVVWNVPFARNPFFTGRDQELERLHAKFQQSQSQVISGLGGIGKTHMAIEYAYRFHQDYQAVFWVRADSIETLKGSCNEIASLLSLPEHNAQDQEVIIQAVKVWLQTHQGWLLILDNADEPDHFAPFLSNIRGGHLLVTTRAADLTHLGLGFAHSLEVKPFSPKQGALFLLRRALNVALDQSASSDQALAIQISDKLGDLPLALDQAGAYIAATRTSLASYLSLYEQRHGDLLKQRRNLEYPASVAATWDISFERVKTRNVTSIEILTLCAFLAPDAIPETILTQGAIHLSVALKAVATDTFLLNEAIEVLMSYSLLSRDSRTQMLSVHRLVQTVLRDKLDAKTRKHWAEQVVKVVHTSSPNVLEMAQWDDCERWLPHALVCATWIDQEQVTCQDAVGILNQAGVYLYKRARYREAEPLFLQATNIWEQQADLDMMPTLNNLAALYMSQERYDEAELLLQGNMILSKQQIEVKDSVSMHLLNNLALVYVQQGKYGRAEPLYQYVLSIAEQQLGAMHPADVAQTLNNLAVLYRMQREYSKAEPLLLRALAIKEEQLGPLHPDTAQSLDNLGVLYAHQGKYAEAEALSQRALYL